MPRIYSIVTGFFPETEPKETWASNPRPLLVCGTAKDPHSGIFFCRIAYGTSQNLSQAHTDDLVIGNLSILDALGLQKPTRFVINAGKWMVIMPWTSAYFRPWTGFRTPILSVLPEEMQRFVGQVLVSRPDLPRF